ncbi:polysaccharide deacetylase family protein [Clostridium folliculivorans]|uniref:Deacetylase n=1 Tax=Clostridium folliculivorans TaxID=2886038 RepID=A0A9W6DBS5_9CLOT|nr:polysaccharide deacetylase family protein [Clostridium folliculivorans]GKU26266.1 deacetylase [Clostridium folliculivorans]GKU31938.1 deacetylase [Clostridium folliculivorans]
MKKKDTFLSIVCIILTISIILVVFIGQSARKNSSLPTSETKVTAKETTKVPSTTDKVVDNTKATSTDTSNKDRFSGLKLTNDDNGLPILCYHDINSAKGTDLVLDPAKFKEQMKYLKDNGYFPITLDELYSYFKDNKGIPEKSIVITFDDGYVGTYTYAFPILKEFGFKATIFMISDSVNNPSYLNVEQLKELSKYGIDIQSHFGEVSNISKLNLDKQIDTLKKSKQTLEGFLSKPISYVAFPSSNLSEDSKKAAEQAGYKMSFNLQNTSLALADKKDNIYNLDRLYIGNKHSLNDFIKILNTKKK